MTSTGIVTADIKYVPNAAAAAIQSYRISVDDIYISVAGTLGLVGVVPAELDGANLTENADKLTSITCDRDYLKYWLRSPSTQRTIDAIRTVGAQPKLALGRIAKFALVMPSDRKEQRAIADALGDVDALLDTLDRQIAKHRDLKQAAMQQLLTGRTRLPGFTGEWPELQLGEVASFGKGFGLPKSALAAGGTEPCIHYGELFTQYGVSIRETISRTNATPSVVRSTANDVLMPTSDVTPRGLAKASCVLDDGVMLGGDILIIRADGERVDGTFLSCLIRYDADQVLKLVTGSTVYHLYAGDMRKFRLGLPSLAEQTAIAAVLSDMDAEIAALEVRRAKTRDLKQAMLQELLTGRTRLV